MTASELAAKVLKMRADAIEAKVAELVAGGCDPNEIMFEHQANGNIRIVARREYVADFEITLPELKP